MHGAVRSPFRRLAPLTLRVNVLSHPPRPRAVVRALVTACALAGAPLAPTTVARAQVPTPVPTSPARPDSIRADSARRPGGPGAGGDPASPDTTVARRGPRRVRAGAAAPARPEPPITPRRAFITSLLVPGWGQARLDRPTTGAIFITIELAALAMVSKAAADLRSAKAFRTDSLTVDYPLDPQTGAPTARPPRQPATFTNELVRSRRLQLEDWFAVMAFNHLFAGAEAYVSANLWDLPTQIGVSPSSRGLVVSGQVRW